MLTTHPEIYHPIDREFISTLKRGTRSQDEIEARELAKCSECGGTGVVYSGQYDDIREEKCHLCHD